MRGAEVIVTLPVEGRFHYSVPDAMSDRLSIGDRVLVPFGPRKVTAFVTALDAAPPEGVVPKPILARLDDAPILTADLLAIVTFAAEYYLAPVGEVLRIALPPGLTAASVEKYRLTSLGKEVVAGAASLLSGEDLALLSSIGAAGVKKTLIPRAAAVRLLDLGMIALHQSVGAKEGEERIEVVERTPAPVVIEALGRAHVQRRVLEMLEQSGPLPLDDLASSIGRASFRRALKPLIADGWVQVVRRLRSEIAPLPAPEDRGSSLTLTAEQTAALEAITSVQRGAFLLRGVTGSGKTEVYLRAISSALASGRGAIVLVPEIALTAQLEARFRARFGDQVVVLHSAVADGERRRRWQRLRSGEATIALGPRSAVWAPVQNLGIIVVDEEHDPSFKQQSDVRYHGRDLALLRAFRAGAVAVLGSATPSLETRQLVETQRLVELRLMTRATGAPLPSVTVEDLSRSTGGEIPILTRPLGDALRFVVSRGEQAIVFLNRRGFNTIVVCEECKEPRRCTRCDVSLTHHKGERALICHYCGHREAFSAPCRKCRSLAMKPFGAGTERVVEAVREAVPDVRVLRLDRDVAGKVGALDETLARFREGAADVLVGTQMVTKGHDFPKVTLVGIVCADTSLAFPDFRAAERTFQLLTQVAGRAGRAAAPGRVIIQTFQPDHYALVHALHHDDEAFFRQEIEIRRSADYPPLSRMGLIRVESSRLEKLEPACLVLSREARFVAEARGLKVRGPVPAPIAKIKDRHRRMLMILAPTPATLVAVMRAIRERVGKLPGVDLIYDLDPLDLL